ncbi:MAG: carbon-nitrogen hydrolase family protein [Acidobacteriota bacterium]|nr:carbon-nitrogen hydrolase family protein [Acidobacteriota bacterium]
MRLALAQTHPTPGDIAANLAAHLRFIRKAVSLQADLVLFPELSLIGYEPALAGKLEMPLDDPRLDAFQQVSDAEGTIVGVGAPIAAAGKPQIGLIFFRPHEPRKLYGKHHLHADEEPFFSPAENSWVTLGESLRIGPAICYEISVPEHAERAVVAGAEVYLASVAKTVPGVEVAGERLAAVAKRYSMLVLMANCVGWADGERCGGRSAVWDERGRLLGQLDGEGEGLLLFDTETREVMVVGL